MAYETLQLEKQGYVAVLTLNRPANNAVSYAMLQEIDQALDEVAADKEARVLVITGTGEKSFCAGMDVADAVSHPDVGAVGRAIWTKLDRLEKPTIAAINGHALGGGLELALACHFRYMADSANARLGCPELNLGIIPGWGGTQRLTRLLGRNKALDLILNSSRLSPQEALAVGLVDALYPPEELMSKVMEKATALSEKAPLAVRSAIRAANTFLNEGIDEGLRVEGEGADVCACSKDAVEGFTAFMQKRKPAFTGE
ncbi:MAG TPA: enoyl-CoA hydratase-related protein [Deltaproteobacteria bacterium]|jgi:enoyl-CoA hydratase/carnithine racemase|nr:enoyl-CoA hydratase-related protein [Deltaproteobacteria bacterium]HOI06903.1 enoyl-CoA hydratase-related protein [Deltaproteobacteria bacterium]